MDKNTRQQILLGINGTDEGRALKDFLQEKLGELDNVDTIDSPEELKGRQLAKKKIKEIFSFVKDLDKPDKPKNQWI